MRIARINLNFTSSSSFKWSKLPPGTEKDFESGVPADGYPDFDATVCSRHAVANFVLGHRTKTKKLYESVA